MTTPTETEIAEALADILSKYEKLRHRIVMQRRLGLAHQDDGKLLEKTTIDEEAIRALLERAAGVV